MTRRWLSLFALAAACAPKGPAATETLPKLREALQQPVTSPAQNKANSDLVETISEEGHLLGLSRLEVEKQLGKGDECSIHELCRKQGFEDTDWYYEVGEMGEGYVRLRPALIVGFDRFGKAVRTYNLRVE
jgi:hypothetical protein